MGIGGRSRPISLSRRIALRWRCHGLGRQRLWSGASVWPCSLGRCSKRLRRSAHRRRWARGTASLCGRRAGWQTIWLSMRGILRHLPSGESSEETIAKISKNSRERSYNDKRLPELVKPEDEILPYIPEDRIDDVVFVNPV